MGEDLGVFSGRVVMAAGRCGACVERAALIARCLCGRVSKRCGVSGSEWCQCARGVCHSAL
eukprot:11654461-Alexandrium_andersonii.AAC.1